MKPFKFILMAVFIIPVHLLSQNQTVGFQDGIDSYNGTIDTYVDNTNPNSSFGSATSLLWDRTPAEYTTFIRFDNLFVSQGGPIPDNSFIVSATLTYYVFNAGNDAAVSEVLISWDNSLTWNQFDFNNDIGTFVGTAESGTVNTFQNIDVTPSLTSWSSNASLNNGWIFQFTGDDGSDIYSSEWTTISQRPKLTVVYSDNFPPDQPVLIAPTDSSTGIDLSTSLIVCVTDPENDVLEVRYFMRAVSTSAGSNFTLIGVPDTQYYTNNVNNNQYFYDQTNWIVANKDALNIAFVSQFGDCVQSGNTYDSEWQVVNTAWSMLENPVTTGLVDGMAYGLNVGNHDQTPIGGGSSASTLKFNQYFGISRFQGRGYYGGHYGSDNDNHHDLFSAGGMDFIVLNLEYDTTPEQDVLDWADALLKTYSNRRAILTTHYLIETDNSANPNAFGAQGQIIYDNLKDNPNLFLMLCGHNHGEGRRYDIFNGNTINTLLADYQDYPHGGNGFLRIMEFRPAENKIYVSTYSPSLDQFETDANSEFFLDYDMDTEAFQEIGHLTGISSGSDATLDLSLLSAETEYEWYVEVSDGFNTVTGPIWSFTTQEDNPLPIFLSSFTASRTELGIRLEWTVESEIENAGFIIEKSRSSENGLFTKIASYEYMEELKGRGNASNRKTYSFVDGDILSDHTYFYRLADVSTNGLVTYHGAIGVSTSKVIVDFELQQNYPNPFNPLTTIFYSIPGDDLVKIKIYDLLGKEIAILVNEFQKAGIYSVNFNARELASGFYFCTLKAGNLIATRRMLLIE
jgi:hypothetical protein